MELARNLWQNPAMHTKSPFQTYLMTFGNMTPENPELLRLSAETGFSVHHLYKAAFGSRPISRACAIAITSKVRKGRKIPAVTTESLLSSHVPLQAPARSDTRKPANGLVRAVGGR